MKLLFLFLFPMLLLSSCSIFRGPMRSVENASLDEIIAAVQNQYKKALDSLKKRDITTIKITKAEVKIEVSRKTEANGEVKLLVLKGGGKRSSTKSSSVTYTLSEKVALKGGGLPKLINYELKDLIVASAMQFAALEAIDPLTKDEFSINLVFSIEDNGNAGIEFDIWGIEVGGGVDRTRSAGHEVTLTFKLLE